MNTKKEYSDAINFMKRKGIKPSELIDLVKAAEHGNPYTKNIYSVGSLSSTFLLGGDLHVGNNEYKRGLIRYAAKIADKEHVDFIALGGDLFDGWYQNRPASIFEQNAIGLDHQLKMLKSDLKNFQQPIYFITGNHEYNTFMRGAGIEVGSYLEIELNRQGNEAHYLGNAEGTIMIGNKTKYDLLHPDGGTAYALSYRPQKIIESLEGGKKPQLLSIHHFHKAEYLFYRNIHCIQGATFCGQTKFMKGKNISAHLGFYIVKIEAKDNGQIDTIIPKFYPAYN